MELVELIQVTPVSNINRNVEWIFKENGGRFLFLVWATFPLLKIHTRLYWHFVEPSLLSKFRNTFKFLYYPD